MINFENNAYFWQKLDTLILTGNFIVKYEKGQIHKKHTNLIYPMNYALLTDEKNAEDKGIPCFMGSNGEECLAVIVSVDILSKECVAQLLIGCNEEEEEAVLSFLNQTEFQKTIIVRRGNDVPNWAI